MCKCNPQFTQTKIQEGQFLLPFFLSVLKILSTKNKPRATQGPIQNANNKVPIPTVPPKYQPNETTVISRKALTSAIVYFQDGEEYEKCAHIFKIQEIVKEI